MIWSIMPEQIIFAAEENPDQALLATYLGRQMLLRPGAGGLGQIIALLSTDPADFLDSRLMPGQQVPLG